MRPLRVFPAALMIGIATFAAAEPPIPEATANPVFYLPAAANTAGLFGAQFRTRVFIAAGNLGGINVSVVAATPSGLLMTALIPLIYNYTSENILEDLFHYSGGAALSFTLGPGNPGTFLVRAEVYTDGPFGEVSTQVPLLTSNGIVFPPPQNSYTTFLSIGLRSDSGHRLNVGCSNFGSDPASVGVDIYPADPAESNAGFWTHTFSLLPGQWLQTSVDKAADPAHPGPPVFSLGTARFYATYTETETVALPIFCYVVNVSNSSNDGTLVPAIQYTGGGIPIPSASQIQPLQ